MTDPGSCARTSRVTWAPFLAALQGVAVRDLLIEPARLEEAFLEYYDDAPAGMTGALFARTLAAHRVRHHRVHRRDARVGRGAAARLRELRQARTARSSRNNPMLEQFSQFGGGDLFSLARRDGARLHPPVRDRGHSASSAIGVPIRSHRLRASAGHPRGAARRGPSPAVRSSWWSRWSRAARRWPLAIAAQLVSSVVGSTVAGVGGRAPESTGCRIVWAMGLLLFAHHSWHRDRRVRLVRPDRTRPGVTLAIVLGSYLLEVIASLWTGRPLAR